MAQRNYAPPTGFTIVQPTTAAQAPAPAPAEQDPVVAAPAQSDLPPPPKGFTVVADTPDAPEPMAPATPEEKAGLGGDAPLYVGTITGGAKPEIQLPAGADQHAIDVGLHDLITRKAPSSEITDFLAQHGVNTVSQGFQSTMQQYDQDKGENVTDPGHPFYVDFHYKNAPPVTAATDAAMDGIKHGALMGGEDEIGGFGGAVGNMLGRTPGVNTVMRALTGKEFDPGTGKGFMADYDRDRQQEADIQQAEYDQHPLAYDVGAAAGMVPTFALPGGAAARVTGFGRRAAALAGVGGAYGALSGALNSDPDHRIEGAEHGAIPGAIGGVILPPVLTVGGRIASRVGERLGINALASRGWSGLEALLSRAPQDVDAIAGRVEAQRAAGMDPTLAHVLDEQGAGTLRAAGQRGDARSTARQFGQQGRADVQDDVIRAAAPIAPESRPVQTMVDETLRGRTALADHEYEQIRHTEVPVTDEVRRVLDTGAGRKALASAIETSDSPEEVAGFLTAFRGSGSPSELDRAMSLLPEGMSDAAKASVRAQLERQGVKGADPLPPFTLDMLDRVKRSLQARAKSPDASGQSRQLNRMADTLSKIGDTVEPRYAAARESFAGQSRLAEAAETGAGIARGNPDEFIAAARGLGSEPTRVPVMGADGRMQMTAPRQAQGGMHISEMAPGGAFTHEGTYTAPDGREIQVEITKHGDGTATVDIPGNVGNANSFGPATVRDMLTSLREAMPDVDVIQGDRVSGARVAGDAGPLGGRASVDIRPPAPRPVTQRGPSERDMGRMGARRAIENEAGTTGGAPRVATQMAYGRNSLNRLAAIVDDPATAERVRGGMQIARERYDRSQFLDPNVGSKTTSLAGDMNDALHSGVAALAHIKSGPLGWVRAASEWANNAGIRNLDAQRLWELASDPARTDEAIAYMRSKVDDPALAKRVVDSVRSSITGFAGREEGQLGAVHNPREPMVPLK